MDSRLDSVPPLKLSFCPSPDDIVLLLPVIKLDCVVLSEESLASRLPILAFVVDKLPDIVVLSDDCLLSALPIRVAMEERLAAIVVFSDVILSLNVWLFPLRRADRLNPSRNKVPAIVALPFTCKNAFGDAVNIPMYPVSPVLFTYRSPLTFNERLFELHEFDIVRRLDKAPPLRFSFCPSAAVNVLLFPVMRLDCVELSFVPPDMESILPEIVVLSAVCLESIPFIQLF